MFEHFTKNKYLSIFIAVVLTGLISHNVLAMDSANYEIFGDILDGGGGSASSSANYYLTDSIGEPVAGQHDTGFGSDLDSGFLEESNDVLLASIASSESYINNINKNAFDIQCLGVTDNESDQTITCEASFDQTNWYTIGTEASPVNDVTISSTPNVSGWLGYPADGTTTIYARAQDGYFSSAIRYLDITKDVTAPTTTANVLSGTLGTNNWYTSEVDMTITPIDATSGVAGTNYCVDQTDTCTPTTTYTVPVTLSAEGTNYFRYFSTDNADNTQAAQSEEIKIDTMSPTSAPTCTPTDNTYFDDDLSIICTTGTGGTIVRYTDDNSEPDQSSPVWSDQIITTSTTFKLISCDDANNCFATASSYDYYFDNTPPPIPTMNAEPILTMDLDNTVSAVAVVDAGVGGVNYEFCINETNSTTGCTESGWLSDPSYNFSELSDGQIYYYFVRAKDSLNNISDWSSSVFSTQTSNTGDYYYYLENDLTTNAIVNDDLIGWWDYEEYEGTIAYDRSGLENDGSYVGTGETAGQLLSARSFNGSSDYVNIGKNPSVKNQSQRTIETWVNVNSIGNYSPIYFESISTDNDLARLILTIETDGSVKLAGRDTDSSGSLMTFAQTATGEISTGSWYHLVAIYDATTDNHRIFINNINKTTSTTASGTFPNTDPMNNIQLGADSSTFANFTLDETRIYGKVLTDAEINNEYLKRITDNLYLDDYQYTEGIHYFHIRPRSNAYLWGTEQYYEIDYDATAPTIDSITSVASDNTAPYFDTTDNSNTLVIFASADNLNIVDQCKWSETDQSYAAMPNTCTDSSHCTLNLAGEGAKTVYMRCQDDIGNAASSSYVLNYTIDSTAPEVTSIVSVAGDTTPTYYDNTDNSSTHVVYTSSADAVACKWDTSDVDYSSMSNTCTDTANCTLNLSGDGTKNIFMRCIDIAGLSSTTSYNFNYTIDTTPPTINSITSVAGDTSTPYYDTTDNNSTQIIFDVSADATECKWSSIDQAYDSMPNTCSAVGDCTTNLSGQGAKTVYLRCKDEAENKMTTSYEVDYTIDSIVPNVLSITSVAGDPEAPYVDIEPGKNALIVYTASADATSCKWSNANTDYDSMTGTCGSTTNCLVTHNSDGLKTVYMRCADAAGNKSTNSYQVDYEVDESTGNGGIEPTLETSNMDDSGNILVKFTLRTTTPVTNGSIKISLQNNYDLTGLTKDDVHGAGGDVTWTNDEIINDDGVRIAKSSTSWWIERGYAAGEDSIVFPFTGTLDNSDGELSFTIGGLNEPTNPSGSGPYSVTYNLYDNQNGMGDPVEDGDGLVHLNHLVIVTATVPSYLSFDILPVSNGTVNGENITNATSTPDDVDFGLFTGNDDRISAHDLRVSTNATDGYIVTAEYDQTMNSVSNMIYSFPATNANPLSWTPPSGLSGIDGYFGYTTSDQALYTSPVDRFNGNKWAGFSMIPQEVAYAPSPVSGEITRVGYRLNLTNMQPAGHYGTTITYIATPTF